MADPEERRSFMDMRLLLVRGDIGEAESVSSRCAGGLSTHGLSRHEPFTASVKHLAFEPFPLSLG